MAPGLAIFDMDRTLTREAVAHVAGEAFGVREQVKALSARRNAGELTQQQVTLGIAKLFAGVDGARFDEVVKGIPLTPGAEAAVGALRAAGVQVAICSDSFSRATRPLARRLGIGLFAANVLEEQGSAFTGKLLPWGPALGLGPTSQALDKRDAVPLLARKAGVPRTQCAHIGDGDQDALAMGLVGVGIAFNGTPRARAAAQHSVEGDLAPVANLVLQGLRQRGVQV